MGQVMKVVENSLLKGRRHKQMGLTTGKITENPRRTKLDAHILANSTYSTPRHTEEMGEHDRQSATELNLPAEKTMLSRYSDS